METSKAISLSAVIGNIGDYTDDAILITEAEPVGLPGPRIVWANKAFERMTGYTLEEIRGKTPRILQGNDTDHAALAKIRTALDAWKPVRVELKNYRKDGSPFWVDLGIQPVTTDDGWHHYWIAIQRETSERHERENLLQRTTRIIESAPIAFGLLSADNRITFANDFFTSALFGDRIPPALPLPYESWLRHAMTDSRESAGDADAWRRRHLSGLFSTPGRIEQRLNNAWYEFRRITTNSGDQLVIGEDIEQRIELQEQIRHMTKLDAMGQLTSGVAHDFNNILAVILGNVELLNDEDIPEDRDLFIAETIGAVMKGRSLTQSLLSFARKSHLAPVAVDVGELARQTAEMFMRTSGKGIEVAVDVPSENLPTVFVDPNLFQNALLNLLINARDAIPGGGSIWISAFASGTTGTGAADGRAGSPDPTEGPRVKVCVADDGAGMEDHVLKRAIEPFFTTKKAGSGSGLGLSMVRGFVEQSGGILTFQSRSGAGTTITLDFPAEGGVPAASAQAEHDPLPLPDINVLMAEDDPGLRRLLNRVLERAGATVTAVGSCDEAMLLEEDWPQFDLLITDIVMPGSAQGDVLAQRFSDRCPDTPVMILSGNPEITNSSVPGESAKLAVLLKPVVKGEFIQRISDLLHGARV